MQDLRAIDEAVTSLSVGGLIKLKKFATWPVRGLEFVADFDYVDKGAVPCGLMDWFDRWVGAQGGGGTEPETASTQRN